MRAPTGVLFSSLFDTEGDGSMFLRNVGILHIPENSNIVTAARNAVWCGVHQGHGEKLCLNIQDRRLSYGW
jgi:hypothetical protein